jgi:hypothetical protein
MARPPRQVDTAELLRLRAEGCYFPEISRRLRLGLGTVHRAYQAASGAPQPFQNPNATVLRGETNNTQEPDSVPAPESFDLPAHLKIRLWLLRARFERAARQKRSEVT